jgi:hypothetical protein
MLTYFVPSPKLILQRSGRFRLRSGEARLATDFAFLLFIAIDKKVS